MCDQNHEEEDSLPTFSQLLENELNAEQFYESLNHSHDLLTNSISTPLKSNDKEQREQSFNTPYRASKCFNRKGFTQLLAVPDIETATRALKGSFEGQYWIKTHVNHSYDGEKIYYDCCTVQGAKCPVKLCLLIDDESLDCSIFISTNEHDHAVIQKPRGIHPFVKELIDELYELGYPNNKPKQVFTSLQQMIRNHMMPTYSQLNSYLASKRKKEKKRTEINEMRNTEENRNNSGSEVLEDIQSKSAEDSKDTNSLESYFAYCIGDYSESSDSVEVL